ncbi:MAG: hypothetical protein ABI813_07220 [Bacteroidota bacterium]
MTIVNAILEKSSCGFLFFTLAKVVNRYDHRIQVTATEGTNSASATINQYYTGNRAPLL